MATIEAEPNRRHLTTQSIDRQHNTRHSPTYGMCSRCHRQAHGYKPITWNDKRDDGNGNDNDDDADGKNGACLPIDRSTNGRIRVGFGYVTVVAQV
ncbi:hypothetical protein [Absidia glauca]|uniref:Uncharacterized protein n=1 Tax=Absidia glauca TaxID=4829 RepID=A0A168S395_ABSGL|nr:hypothetical protein [Absidia glauca]